MDKAFIRFQHLAPQHGLSRLVGTLAASNHPLVKKTFIKLFHDRYQIDMSLAEMQDLNQFGSFNEFFTRALKAHARPVDTAIDSIVSPADGAISQLGKIEGDEIFQAKNQSFSLNQLIGDAQLAQPFVGGEFATVYLSPKDYHRVHMPFAGRLTDTIYVPGKLFSVNTVTAENVPALFARNERLVCLFDTEVGRMAVVLVGAMIVAGIECVATGKIKPSGKLEHRKHDLQLDKGTELGRFYLGSTAIVLFENSKINWLAPFEAGSHVMMGQAMGKVL
ncbi:archaetidylserine decarboxylase [Alkanindiges sp. WGS2144]|uniref:archaetidylserine decarboxylase n=1 Tax=Alkanindiges sp. WGS2144 TaxID=3366808 RepID=UPI003750B756